MGKTLTMDVGGYLVMIKFNRNGSASYSKNTIDQVEMFSDTGNAYFEDEKICVKWKSRFSGMKYCIDIYKNPTGSPETGNDYISVIDVGVLAGTVKK